MAGKGNWKEVIYGEKTLTDEIAENILKASKKIRENFEMKSCE